MLVLIHVIVALSSLVVTAFSALSPSIRNLRASATLVAATLLSGALVTIMGRVHLLSVCVSGLVFLCVSAAGIVFGYRRLRQS